MRAIRISLFVGCIWAMAGCDDHPAARPPGPGLFLSVEEGMLADPAGEELRIDYRILDDDGSGRLSLRSDEPWVHSFDKSVPGRFTFRVDANDSERSRSTGIHVHYIGHAHTLLRVDQPPRRLAPEPEGVVSVELYDERHGKTLLEGTGVYMDAAGNLTGGEHGIQIVDFGSVKGIGNIDFLTRTGAGSSCAITPGHGYVTFGGERFFSDRTSADYLEYSSRIYVESYMEDQAGKKIGVRVRYQRPFTFVKLPRTYGEFVSEDAAHMGWSVYEESPHNKTYYITCGGQYTWFYAPIE